MATFGRKCKQGYLEAPEVSDRGEDKVGAIAGGSIREQMSFGGRLGRRA
jgi:hypothetical protein